MFYYGAGARFYWRPFQRALFYNWYDQPDRAVEMPGGEKYCCNDNIWTVNTVAAEPGRRELIGFLIKKTEERLRQAFNYKYSITAKPGAFAKDLKQLGIPVQKLTKAVESAVADFHKNLSRTVVTVDHDNLARIRREALGTQNRLIVAEDESAGIPVAPVAPPGTDFSVGESYAVSDIGFNVGDAYATSAMIPAVASDVSSAVMPTIATDAAPDAVSAAEAWKTYNEALNAVEREALLASLRSPGDVKAVADANGVMLEVLIDGINEKAVDAIGDSVLEIDGEPFIYDEYKEQVEKYVKLLIGGQRS
jgi:hypothetical protein